MNSIISADWLFPVCLLILQCFLILFGTSFLLKRLKLLQQPYAGMEYSQVIAACSYICGTLLISSADAAPLIQTFKSFQNAGTNVISNTFSKFSLFFFVTLFFEIIYLQVGILLLRFFGERRAFIKSISEGSIPAALLTAAVLIPLSLLIRITAVETLGYFVPQVINFR